MLLFICIPFEKHYRGNKCMMLKLKEWGNVIMSNFRRAIHKFPKQVSVTSNRPMLSVEATSISTERGISSDRFRRDLVVLSVQVCPFFPTRPRGDYKKGILYEDQMIYHHGTTAACLKASEIVMTICQRIRMMICKSSWWELSALGGLSKKGTSWFQLNREGWTDGAHT